MRAADASATGALAHERTPPGGAAVMASGGSAGSSRKTAPPCEPTTSTGSAAAGAAAAHTPRSASRTARTSTCAGYVSGRASPQTLNQGQAGGPDSGFALVFAELAHHAGR